MAARRIFIICTAWLCTACWWISGSDPHQDFITQVPEGTIVRDVYTGATVAIDSVETDSQWVKVISLRNGKRHALQFKTDSGVHYRTYNLKRNVFGVLNVYSPLAVGFLVESDCGYGV